MESSKHSPRQIFETLDKYFSEALTKMKGEPNSCISAYKAWMIFGDIAVRIATPLAVSEILDNARNLLHDAMACCRNTEDELLISVYEAPITYLLWQASEYG